MACMLLDRNFNTKTSITMRAEAVISIDPDETAHHELPHLNRHCLPSITHYRISSIIRQSFFLPKQSQRTISVFKTDLDLWDCLGRVKLVL